MKKFSKLLLSTSLVAMIAGNAALAAPVSTEQTKEYMTFGDFKQPGLADKSNFQPKISKI